MADYTISLTNTEDLLLTFWLEHINAQRSQQTDEEGNPLPLFTAEQLLQFSIRNDLQNRRNELHNSTQELFSIARNLTPTQRTALLNQISDGARKSWLQVRITANQ
jgi:hypothetical protein